MSIASGVEPRQVEELLDQPPHPLAFLGERLGQRLLLLVSELSRAGAQGLGRAGDRRDRGAQLVGGQRDEVRHQAVRPLEREPGVALLGEEPRPVEREERHLADGARSGEVVRTEERRVRRRPDQELAGRHPHRDGRDRPCLVRAQPVRAERLAVRVAQRHGARTDELGHARQDQVDDLLLGRRAHQLRDGRLHAPRLVAPPVGAHGDRRRERQQEGEHGSAREELSDERARGRGPTLQRRDEDRHGDQGARRREGADAPAREGGLAGAAPPEPRRHEEREQRPVHEEPDEVDLELPRAVLARGREAPDRERGRDQTQRQEPDVGLVAAPHLPERHGEAVQQVGEEDEDRDQGVLRQHPPRAVGMVADEASEQHDRAERAERERGPEGRLVAPLDPAAHHEQGQSRVDHEIDVLGDSDGLVHTFL